MSLKKTHAWLWTKKASVCGAEEGRGGRKGGDPRGGPGPSPVGFWVELELNLILMGIPKEFGCSLGY
jgi:hypothetical protein